jgi:hypothetical protein
LRPCSRSGVSRGSRPHRDRDGRLRPAAAAHPAADDEHAEPCTFFISPHADALGDRAGDRRDDLTVSTVAPRASRRLARRPRAVASVRLLVHHRPPHLAHRRVDGRSGERTISDEDLADCPRFGHSTADPGWGQGKRWRSARSGSRPPLDVLPTDLVRTRPGSRHPRTLRDEQRGTPGGVTPGMSTSASAPEFDEKSDDDAYRSSLGS